MCQTLTNPLALNGKPSHPKLKISIIYIIFCLK